MPNPTPFPASSRERDVLRAQFAGQFTAALIEGVIHIKNPSMSDPEFAQYSRNFCRRAVQVADLLLAELDKETSP